jgi:hypothetical protein
MCSAAHHRINMTSNSFQVLSDSAGSGPKKRIQGHPPQSISTASAVTKATARSLL